MLLGPGQSLMQVKHDVVGAPLGRAEVASRAATSTVQVSHRLLPELDAGVATGLTTLGKAGKPAAAGPAQHGASPALALDAPAPDLLAGLLVLAQSLQVA